MGIPNDGSGRRPEAYKNRGAVAGIGHGADSIFNTPIQIFHGIPRLDYGPRSLAGRTSGTAVTVAGLGRLGAEPDNVISTAPPAAPVAVPVATKWSPWAVGAVLMLAYFGLKRKH